MDAYKTEILTSLIAKAVCGKELALPDGCELTDSLLAELYALSRAHDVSHLVGAALSACGILDSSTASGAYSDSTFFAIYRYENMSFTLKQVKDAFESQKIPFIPLKGAVLAELYPEPWMRTSCDIDILVHEQDIGRAASVLTDILGFSEGKTSDHDMTFISKEGICVDLHFSLFENKHFKKAVKILSEVWSYASPVKEGCFEQRINADMLLFYHIAHMARHFLRGGCGIRPFIDLYLLIHNTTDGFPYELLKKADLVRFGESVAKLSRIWFDSDEHDETTLIMQSFILDGGNFGSDKTRHTACRNIAGGKKRYIASRLFLPYDKLKNQYPILNRHRFLTPACEICRLFSFAVGKKKKLRKEQLEQINNLNEESLEKVLIMFENTGLV